MCDVSIINFFKIENFKFSVNFANFLDFSLISLIVFNFLDNSLIFSFMATLLDLRVIRVLVSKHDVSCEEKEDGNSDRTKKTVSAAKNSRYLRCRRRRGSVRSRGERGIHFVCRGNSETPAVAAVGSAPRRCKNTR